jgi:myotubularin-related protein 5/13
MNIGTYYIIQGVKLESFPKCDFIPVDFYEVRHVKASFKKLSRACVPSSTQGPDASFHKAVEESGWLPQVCPKLFCLIFYTL